MNVILSPHLDDAVLSLGGLLAREGPDTLVATLFTGVPPEPIVRRWDRKCGFKDSSQAMRKRLEENREALNFFSVKDDYIRNYAYLDAQYRNSRHWPLPREPELEAAIGDELSLLLEEFNDRPLKIFVPSLEMHPDHHVVKRVAQAFAQASTLPKNIEFFFYQDLPYAYLAMERAHLRSIWNFYLGKDPARWNYAIIEDKITQGAFSVEPPTIFALSEAEMEKKIEGLGLYDSQIGPLGRNLFERLKQFAAGQARSLSLAAPYCEVAYMLRRATASEQEYAVHQPPCGIKNFNCS